MESKLESILKSKLKSIIAILSILIIFIDCSPKKKDKTLEYLLILGFLASRSDGCPLGETAGDPLYKDQWHWKNDGTLSDSLAGEDAKVTPVWADNYKGSGIRIAVVDDGVDTRHEDLAVCLECSRARY
jgi:subtilisin family serine protease